jgi:sterol desaturase/sphingolipid hydroxylase (fatty acid hydroxylase superfamily)
VAYGLAKVFEVGDQTIFAIGHVISGHTIKHLTAVLSVTCLVRMLRARAATTPSAVHSKPRLRGHCMTLPIVLIAVVTALFLLAERLAPGRDLPNSRGWYVRALGINFVQLLVTVATGRLWPGAAGEASLFHLTRIDMPAAEGFVAWFVGTFVFYWWHRLRHQPGFWEVFHQIHHSPSRIEIVTAFYKHPIEIAADALVSAIVIYGLLGCSLLGAVWYSFFAAAGEYFYHANLRTPSWVRHLIQTPELHIDPSSVRPALV